MPALAILGFFTLLALAFAPFTIITWDAQPIVEDAYRLVNGQLAGKDYSSPFGLLTATTGALGLLIINKYWGILIGSSIYIFCIGLATLKVCKKDINTSFALCAMSLIYAGFALTYRLPGYEPGAVLYTNLYNHVSASILICLCFVLYTFRDAMLTKGRLIFLCALLISLFFGKIAYYLLGLVIIFIHCIFYSKHWKSLATACLLSLLISLVVIYALSLNDYLRFSYLFSSTAVKTYSPTSKLLSINYVVHSFLGMGLEFVLQTIGVMILFAYLWVSGEKKIAIYGLVITGLLSLLFTVVIGQPPEPIFYALFFYIFIERYIANISRRGGSSDSILVLVIGLFLIFQMVIYNHQIALKAFIPAIYSRYSNSSSVVKESCGLAEAIQYQNPIRVGGQDLTFFTNQIQLPKYVPLYWHEGVTFSNNQYVGTSLDDVNVIIFDSSAMLGSIKTFEDLFDKMLKNEFTKITKTELCAVLIRNSVLNPTSKNKL